MASGTILTGRTIFHKLLKGTTSAAGNLVTGLNIADYVIIGAATNRAQSGYLTESYNLIPCGADASGNLFLTAIKPSDMSLITRTAIAVDIWYIDNDSVDVT